MEQRPDQQPVNPGPIALPPGYTTPAPYYVAPARPARPGRALVFWRTLRLLLRRALYGLALLGRALRPYAALLAIIVVLLGVIGWMSIQLWWPADAASRDTRVNAMAPAPAVENFIRGQQGFNAELMWNAFSASYQAAQLQKGSSKETLQAAVDQQRESGLRYAKYDYIGGVPADDGGHLFFYSLQLAASSQQVRVPLVFGVDKDGRINHVYLITPE